MAELSPVGHALAGAFGGILSNSVVYPLDTVKTRIQADMVADSKQQRDEEQQQLPEPTLKRSQAPRRLSTISKKPGIRRVLGEILKEQGLGGFYRGFSANMLNSFSMQFAYFYWQTMVRNTYMSKIRPLLHKSTAASPRSLSTATELLLGAIAGALAQVFTIPVSVIATRQQLEGGADGCTIWQTLQDILRADGVAGLWRGLKPSLVLTVNPAITYGMFERLKTLFLGDSGKMTPGKAFLIGALSKAMATVVTYPYIFAKVRLQAKYAEGQKADGDSDSDAESDKAKQESAQTKKKAAGERYDGALDVLAKVRQEKGLAGWYQGIRSQILKAVLAQALLFGAKEQLEEFTLRLMLAFAALKATRRA